MEFMRRLTGDRSLRDVAAGATRVYAVRLAGAAAGFGFHILAARLLGAGGLGIYYLGLSIAVIASLVARLGLDNALLRFAAAAADRGDWPGVRGVRHTALLLVSGMSVLLSLVVLALAGACAEVVFDKPEIAGVIRIMALSIVPFSLLNLQGEAFKAVGAGVTATVVQGLGVPLVGLVLLVALGGESVSVEFIAWCYVAATTFVCAAAYVRWLMMARRGRTGREAFPAGRLLRTGLPLLLVASMGAALAPASTFLLGIWLPVEAVGLYGVAQRCASLMLLVFTAVSTVTAPRFAALFGRGQLVELGALARRSGIVAALLAAPLLVLFLPGGGLVLSVFGAEFKAAQGTLAILTLGRFLAVATGNANDLMMMTGRETALRNIVTVTTLAYVGFIVLLVPTLGTEGAALARSVTAVATNVASVIYIHHRVGIGMVPGPLRPRGDRS